MYLYIIVIVIFIYYLLTVNKVYVKNDHHAPILILAGVHGNESGPADFFTHKDLPPEFTVIPRVNALALKLNIRGIPDINRNWPDGTNINRQILPYIDRAKIIIDFHEGWGNGCTPPSLGQSLYTTDGRYQDLLIRLADRLNRDITDDCMRWRVLLDQTAISGTLDEYCRTINRPYILVEMMGQDSGVSQEEKDRQLTVITDFLIRKNDFYI